MEPSARRIKLPFWKTVGESYTLGFANLGTLIASRWLVLLLAGLFTFAAHWLVHPYELAQGNVGGSWVSVLAIPAASLIFTAMIAVPWHRLILAGEPMTGLGLDFSPRVLSYLIWSLALTVPFLLSLVVFTSYAPKNSNTQLDGVQAMALLVGMSVMFASMYALTRLWLKLVAVALSDRNGTLGVVWQRSSWSFWRLFWGLTLTAVPMLVAGGIVGGLIGGVAGATGSTTLGRIATSLINGASGLVGAMFAVITLTFISLAYKHLMYGQGQQRTDT